MASNQENSKRVAKNTGFLFIRMILVLIVGLYTSRLVLQYLGFEDFGIYNVVGSIVVFFGFLKNALTNATYRYIAYEIGAGNKESISKIYSMAINCHIILAIVFWVLLELVGVWFLNVKLNIPGERLYAANWAFQFSLLTFCVSVVQTPFHSNIIAHERMNFYAILSVLEVILKLVIVYVLLCSPIDKLITYSALLFIVTTIICLCYYVYNRISFQDSRYVKYWDIAVVKKFASYSGWSLIVNVTDVCTTQSISIFFNMFLGVIANAALGICNQVTAHINSFLTNFTQAFNPQIVKSYAAGKYDYFMKMILSTAKLSYYLLFIVSFPVLLNIEFILKIWLGKYPDMAPSFICITMIYSLIDATQSPLWNAAHATGNIKWHQIIVASIKVFAIPTMYLLLRFGYSASVALASWVIINGFVAVARVIYMKRLIHLSVRKFCIEVVGPILLFTLLVIPLPYILKQSISTDWLAFIYSFSLSVFLSVIVIGLVGLNKREKKLLMSVKVIQKICCKIPFIKNRV